MPRLKSAGLLVRTRGQEIDSKSKGEPMKVGWTHVLPLVPLDVSNAVTYRRTMEVHPNLA